MADEIRALSLELANDPDSLVFLRLGELLRVAGQANAAARVGLAGLHRHPHLADAHDLYARILADAGDTEQAGDEWSTALSLAPRHGGAHKGLGFLAYQQGDLDAALEHLELALASDPTDPSIVQALRTVRNAFAARIAAVPDSPEARRGRQAFGGLEGADDGLLLVDHRGLVLAGRVVAKGAEVGEAVAAYLAGASQEAGRYEPRALDIDILLYGEEVISASDDLHIPHLLMHERGFVLRPLADLAPDLEHPVLYQTVRELLEGLEDDHQVVPADLSSAWW